MGAKFCTVKTELILLGLAAAFLGVLLGISAGDRAAAEPVSVSAERALPPEEMEVSGIGEKKFAELRDYVTVGDENKGAES